MTAANEIVARARALLGVRFRPQGREPAAGVDCIGLAAGALGVRGVRCGYRIRGGSVAELEAELERAGLARTAEWSAGDVLVMRTGPEQLHLGIWSGAGLIHADAGLRRVVERPGLPPWPVLAAWRRKE